MKIVARKIIGIIIAVTGLVVTVLSIYLMFRSNNASAIFSLITFLLGGIAIIIAGLSVYSGESIRDILRFLFTGLP